MVPIAERHSLAIGMVHSRHELFIGWGANPRRSRKSMGFLSCSDAQVHALAYPGRARRGMPPRGVSMQVDTNEPPSPLPCGPHSDRAPTDTSPPGRWGRPAGDSVDHDAKPLGRPRDQLLGTRPFRVTT